MYYSYKLKSLDKDMDLTHKDEVYYAKSLKDIETSLTYWICEHNQRDIDINKAYINICNGKTLEVTELTLSKVMRINQQRPIDNTGTIAYKLYCC
jgi:hypothetical protein